MILAVTWVCVDAILVSSNITTRYEVNIYLVKPMLVCDHLYRDTTFF